MPVLQRFVAIQASDKSGRLADYSRRNNCAFQPQNGVTIIAFRWGKTLNCGGMLAGVF